MRFREWILLTVLNCHYFKLSIIAPITLQPPEPLDRRTTGCRTEVQHPAKFFLIEPIHNFPEPPYTLMRIRVWLLILCMIMPVLNIDEGDSIDQHFQLEWLKYLQIFGREHFADAT